MPVIPVKKFKDKKRINRKRRAEEEERHTGSLKKTGSTYI
jgi:hypothetical protein